MPLRATFGPFTLDLRSHTLWEGEAPVELQPRAFDLLVHLARHPDDIHTRDSLQAVLWPDLYVGYEALSQMIRRIRRALRDDAHTPRYLETHPRRGYRFIAPVSWSDGGPAAGATSAGGSAVDQAPSTPPASAAAADFVGRTTELEQLCRHLAGGARLITVLGQGGMGKTRLALEWRARHRPDAVFTDLTDVTSEVHLTQHLAAALALPPDGADDAERERIARALRGRGAGVLVLDNVESVLPWAAAIVARWLAAAPALQIVATSRERLDLSVETVLPLGPLDVEDAARLFRQRAERAGASPETVGGGDVSTLVTRLDGCPLAITLAAGRARSMGVAALLSHLDRRFLLLRGGGGDLPDRHRSLRLALEGSWERLDAGARLVLGRCAPLPGAFGLATAEALLYGGALPDGRWVGEVLGELVDHSMLTARPLAGDPAGGAGFCLAESVRAFVLEEVAAQGPPDADEVNAWVNALGRRVNALLAAGGASEEIPSLLWALEGRGGGSAEGAAEVALGAAGWLAERGPWSLGRRLVDGALERRGALAPDVVARLLLARASLSPAGAAEVGSLLEEAEALAREGGHPGLAEEARLLACERWVVLGRAELGLEGLEGVGAEGGLRRAHVGLVRGAALARLGRLGEAAEVLEEGLALARRGAPLALVARLESARAHVIEEEGRDLGGAVAGYRRSLAAWERLGWPRRRAMAATNLATALLWSGELTAARALLDEALGLFQTLGDTPGEAAALANRSLASLFLRDLRAAEADLALGEERARESGASATLAVLDMNRATARWMAGDLVGARREVEASIETARQGHNTDRLGMRLAWLAGISAAQGDPAAEAHLAEAHAAVGPTPSRRQAEALAALRLHVAAADAHADRAALAAEAAAQRSGVGPQAQLLLDLLPR